MIVEYETDGRVAAGTLNRPEARNAVSGELAQALKKPLTVSKTTTTYG